MATRVGIARKHIPVNAVLAAVKQLSVVVLLPVVADPDDRALVAGRGYPEIDIARYRRSRRLVLAVAASIQSAEVPSRELTAVPDSVRSKCARRRLEGPVLSAVRRMADVPAHRGHDDRTVPGDATGARVARPVTHLAGASRDEDNQNGQRQRSPPRAPHKSTPPGDPSVTRAQPNGQLAQPIRLEGRPAPLPRDAMNTP